MITKTVTYENFNGEEVTKTLYFHLKATALARMELRSETNGHTFPELLQKLIDETQYEKLYDVVEELLLMAYGEKSEDGESFVQSEEMKNEFKNSAAFEAVMTDILMDDVENTLEFIRSLAPKSLLERTNAIAESGLTEA